MARVRYAEVADAELLSRTREDPEAFGVFYGPSFFHGIVPDGVASVVLELPGHRGTVTAKVVDNLYLAPVARSVAAPTRVLWLAADGGVIRTTRMP